MQLNVGLVSVELFVWQGFCLVTFCLIARRQWAQNHFFAQKYFFQENFSHLFSCHSMHIYSRYTLTFICGPSAPQFSPPFTASWINGCFIGRGQKQGGVRRQSRTLARGEATNLGDVSACWWHHKGPKNICLVALCHRVVCDILLWSDILGVWC